MRVLGIDLGVYNCGVAILDIERGVATYHEHYGAMPAAELVLLVAHLRGRCDLLVVETTSGPHGGMGLAQAISAGRACAATNKHLFRIGEAIGIAGIPAVEVSAQEARGALGCGNTDATVKRWVTMQVKEWPKVSANHARDAAVAAIFGARRWAIEKRKAG